MNRKTAKPKVKGKLPGVNAKKWIKFHLKNAAAATYLKQIVWNRGAPAIGPYFTDPDGNVFLDFASHVAANPLGYNHPELIKVAEQLAKINPDRYAGTDFISAHGKTPNKSKLPTPSHLHAKLMEITSQFGFNKAFFTNSGSEAVENAIKICFQYRKNYGYGFTFEGAFHGRTLGALSLNRSKNLHRFWYPQIPKIVSFQYFSEKSHPSYKQAKKRNLNSISYMLDPKKGLVDPKEVAFIIIEPIQGEGGYNIPDPEFIKSVSATAKKYGIPLVCDEIQTGMGRTGKWWACEHFGIKPDIIAAGKALRIGATIGKGKYFPKESSRISSTWGEGNAIASAVGFKTIEVIQKQKLLANATKMGDYFMKELKKIKKKFTTMADVRGIGLLIALELKNPGQRDKLQELAAQKGLIIMACGFKALRILPPLDVTKREIDQALEIIDAALAEIK